MSIAEILLVIGTFGICTGVWVTLFVIIQQHKMNRLDNRKQMDNLLKEVALSVYK